MRILQLCNKAPYPPIDGGAIAIFNLAKTFSENDNQVTILAMNTTKHRTNPESIPEEYTKSIVFIYIPVDTRIRPLALLLNLFFSSKPYNALRFINTEYSNVLKNLLQNKEFDIIQLEGLYMTPYIDLIRKYSDSIIVYRSHNIEHEIWNRTALMMSNPLKKKYFGIISKRLALFEKKMLNAYDLLVPITKRDSKKLQEMGNSRPFKITPASILKENFKKSTAPHNINSLFYIGSLDWIPNQEGLVWFIKNIWNDIKSNWPDLTFHIAGRNAPKWFIRECVENEVTFHGEVENAHKFYENYHIMIVPLFAGSGMRIKIIEAMAQSKVVVTTSIGAEGLGFVNNLHGIITDNASGFIKGINNLLENGEFFTKLEKNSYEFASENFSNEIIGKDLIQFYKQHITE